MANCMHLIPIKERINKHETPENKNNRQSDYQETRWFSWEPLVWPVEGKGISEK